MGNSGQKRNSAEAGLEEDPTELDDTASSPLKPLGEDQAGKADAGVMKKLDMDESATVRVPPPPPEYVSPKLLKKQRRAALQKDKAEAKRGDPKSVETDGNTSTVAASVSEDRQSQ